MWSETIDAVGEPGSPVLLVHSFARSARQDFAELTDGLTVAGHPVVRVDLPGHGHSGRVAPDAATPSAIVAELATMIEAWSRPVDVVGYSLGARLAWELPGTGASVRRLVLGGLSPVDPFAALDLAAARGFVDSGASGADALPRIIATLAMAPGNDPHAVLDCVEGLAREPFAAGGGFDTPTLIVSGREDEMSAGSAALVDGLPDATFARVPGDHLGALHDPAFVERVVGFLAGG